MFTIPNIMDKLVQIHSRAIFEHEPFTGLQIKPLTLVDDHFEWTDVENAQLFGIYGRSAADGLTYSIADCFTLQDARDLCNTFNTLARFTLEIEPELF
jgi:hypothetical protein